MFIWYNAFSASSMITTSKALSFYDPQSGSKEKRRNMKKEIISLLQLKKFLVNKRVFNNNEKY